MKRAHPPVGPSRQRTAYPGTLGSFFEGADDPTTWPHHL